MKYKNHPEVDVFHERTHQTTAKNYKTETVHYRFRFWLASQIIPSVFGISFPALFFIFY